MAAALTASAILALAGQFTDWDPQWVVWQVTDAGTGHGESSGIPDAYNPAGPFRGLMQVWDANAIRFGYQPEEMYDPAKNLAAAHRLWLERGTAPWPSAVKYPGNHFAGAGNMVGGGTSVAYPADEHSAVTSWLKAYRPSGCVPKIIIVHATRGASTQAQQYAATKSWFQSTGNGSASQGWGGCASIVIGSAGELCRFMDERTEVPRYSAGYGSNLPPLGWCADDWGLSMELAQSAQQEPFAAATIDRAAMQAALWCQAYNINPVHLGPIDQRGAVPTVSGIVGHDELENGRKLGKTDPGAQFPWPAFMAKVNYYMGGQVPQDSTEDYGPMKLNADGSMRIEADENGIVFVVKNIPVARIGGDTPGEISKNFNGTWYTLGHLSQDDDPGPGQQAPAVWSNTLND